MPARPDGAAGTANARFSADSPAVGRRPAHRGPRQAPPGGRRSSVIPYGPKPDPSDRAADSRGAAARAVARLDTCTRRCRLEGRRLSIRKEPRMLKKPRDRRGRRPDAGHALCAEGQLRLREDRQLRGLQDVRAQGRDQGRTAADRRSHRRGHRAGARRARASRRSTRTRTSSSSTTWPSTSRRTSPRTAPATAAATGRTAGAGAAAGPAARTTTQVRDILIGTLVDRHRRRQEGPARLARDGRQGSRHAGQAREARQEHQQRGEEDLQELSAESELGGRAPLSGVTDVMRRTAATLVLLAMSGLGTSGQTSQAPQPVDARRAETQNRSISPRMRSCSAATCARRRWRSSPRSWTSPRPRTRPSGRSIASTRRRWRRSATSASRSSREYARSYSTMTDAVAQTLGDPRARSGSEAARGEGEVLRAVRQGAVAAHEPAVPAGRAPAAAADRSADLGRRCPSSSDVTEHP